MSRLLLYKAIQVKGNKTVGAFCPGLCTEVVFKAGLISSKCSNFYIVFPHIHIHNDKEPWQDNE